MFSLTPEPGSTRLVPALHSEFVFRFLVQGMVVAEVAFFFDKNGGPRFAPGAYFKTEKWLDQLEEEVTLAGLSAEASFRRLLGLASVVRALMRDVAYSENLVDFGYGQTGVCIDAGKLLPAARSFQTKARDLNTAGAVSPFASPGVEDDIGAVIAALEAIDAEKRNDASLTLEQMQSNPAVRARIRRTLEQGRSFYHPNRTLELFP